MLSSPDDAARVLSPAPLLVFLPLLNGVAGCWILRGSVVGVMVQRYGI